MLWQRVITALVAAPLFFGVLLCGTEPVQLLFWLSVVAIGALEMGRMLRFLGVYRMAYAALVVLLGLASLFVSQQVLMGLLLVVSALWVFYVPYLLYCYGEKQQLPLDNTLLSLLGAVQIATFLAAVMFLEQLLRPWALLSLFVVVWTADIGAYFVGRAYGKTPLAANISPKKTREGLYGGLVAALVVAWLANGAFHFGLSAVEFMGLSALVVVYSVVGDLWESVLKRRVGLKDSGSILPGHGGVLDRIDSWLVALPLWAMGLMALGG